MHDPNPLLGLFVILIAAAFYFIPTIVAMVKGKRNGTAIFMLNLLAGWTFLGWVIALVWATTYEEARA